MLSYLPVLLMVKWCAVCIWLLPIGAASTLISTAEEQRPYGTRGGTVYEYRGPLYVKFERGELCTLYDPFVRCPGLTFLSSTQIGRYSHGS